MFSYLRYFFLISILVVVLAAAFIGWYSGKTSEKVIMNQAKQSSIAMVDAYRRTIWMHYASNLTFTDLFFQSSASQRLHDPAFTSMAKDTKDFMGNSSIMIFNIYTNKFNGSAGRKDQGIDIKEFENKRLVLFMSLTKFKNSVQAEDGLPKAPGTALLPFDTSSKDIDSELVKDAQFNDGGVQKTGSLVRTLIPLYFSNNPANSESEADAIIEVYYNVSVERSTLANFQYIAIGIILGIFLIMLATLIYISGRTEKTIIKQHETTSELMAAKIKAETSNEQKTQFLASISHELRTPLNAIIGFSEIIKDEVMGPLENEQYKNYIRDIHNSGVHLLSLINDILDFSKAEAGKLDVEYEDVDLNKLIATALRLQEPRAQTGNVKLERDLPADHIVIRTDNKRLKQILLNLLSNAVKFTPQEGKVKVSAWLDIQTGNVCIEVADTGIGIAPKDLAKAMSPFGQISSDLSRRYEGTGLGLPLTKKFTELLGGTMDIESEVGKGTKIRVSLPKAGKENKLSDKAKLVF